MDPKRFAKELGLDTRYLEVRRVRGKTGYVWNNRHAKIYGIRSEWLGYDPLVAAQRADHLNRSYDAERKGEVTQLPEGTLAWWLKKIEKTKKHLSRPDEVRNEVERAFGRLADSPLAKVQLTKIRGSVVEAIHSKMVDKVGLSMAARNMKWLRYALNLAVQEGQIAGSPMEKLRIKRPDSRQVVVWEDEVNALEAYFLEKGRPSLALGIRLGYDVGQRESDILKFPWTRWKDSELLFRQSKTGAIVRIQALPELRAAIEAAEKRTRSTVMMVNEETSRPWLKDAFSHRVNDGFRALGLVDKDTGQPKVFQDLRRSSVVRLGLAGCTVWEIGAITGHSYTRIEQILEVYLPRSTPMAKAAIERLLEWRKRGTLVDGEQKADAPKGS